MEIYELVCQFREAIKEAQNVGAFSKDITFRKFPRGCCGDASDLLAQYLLDNGIHTDYICGEYYGDSIEERQSHAWLQIEGGTIIDITGDQFKYDATFLNFNIPIYCGDMDDFHSLFEVEDRDIRKSVRLEELGEFCYPRLSTLYETILQYIR